MSPSRHSILVSQIIYLYTSAAAWPTTLLLVRPQLTDLKTYFIYVHDDRYAAPTLDVVIAADDAAAAALARQRLAASAHYRRIEVFDGDRPVGEIDRGEGAREPA